MLVEIYKIADLLQINDLIEHCSNELTNKSNEAGYLKLYDLIAKHECFKYIRHSIMNFLITRFEDMIIKGFSVEECQEYQEYFKNGSVIFMNSFLKTLNLSGPNIFYFISKIMIGMEPAELLSGLSSATTRNNTEFVVASKILQKHSFHFMKNSRASVEFLNSIRCISSLIKDFDLFLSLCKYGNYTVFCFDNREKIVERVFRNHRDAVEFYNEEPTNKIITKSENHFIILKHASSDQLKKLIFYANTTDEHQVKNTFPVEIYLEDFDDILHAIESEEDEILEN